MLQNVFFILIINTLLFKKDYVQAIKPGNTYITIIPGGYDSDNQVIINVNIS